MIIPLGAEPRDPDHIPFVTYGLMAAIVAAYGLTTAQMHGDEEAHALFARWGFTPARARVETLVTAMFMHADFEHVIGNVLFLWVFGPKVEWCLGRIGYLMAWSGTGILASGIDWALDPTSAVPRIGASAAISGVLGLHLVAFPTDEIRLFVWWFFSARTFEVFAWIPIAFWFVWDDVRPLLANAEDGTGHVGHLGGFAAGAAWGLVLRRMEARRSAPATKPGGWERWLEKK